MTGLQVNGGLKDITAPGGLPEPEPPAQLGRGGPAGALSHRRLRRRDGRRRRPAGSTSSRSCCSGRPTATCRASSPIRSAPSSGSSSRPATATSRSTASSAPRRSRPSPASRCWTTRRTCRPADALNLGVGQRRAGVRQLVLRRHRPDPRASATGSRSARRSARSNFVGALADYRRYFMPVRPFTLAARLLHYGRYGSGRRGSAAPAAVPRLPGAGARLSGRLVRRVRVPPDRRPIPNACPVFDQLLGSRMVGGQRRAALPAVRRAGYGLGLLRRACRSTSPSSAMAAWPGTRRHEPSVFGSGDPRAGLQRRRRVSGSTCSASRSREVDLVHPFERPDKGWVWEFELAAGVLSGVLQLRA